MNQTAPIVSGRDQVLDRLIDSALAAGPIAAQTDKYFTNTSRIVAAAGDTQATYAVFMRRRVIAALEPVIRVIERLAPGTRIKRFCAEGDLVPAEKKMLEITGSMARLSEIETLFLQKTGIPCVCANNAYEMCLAVPSAAFLDMHARHGSGPDMNILAAYGASVGSDAAKRRDAKVKGFIGSSQDLTAPFFGAPGGLGTMPHALVGYTGGDVLESMKLFAKTIPEAPSLVALVDYTGHEITDALRCARWFYDEAKLHLKGKTFGIRLDTHGGRFAEGLDYEGSVDIVGHWLGVPGEYNIVEQVLGERAVQLDPSNILVDKVRRILFGKGVSVAAIVHARQALNKAGYGDAMIVGSSGFDPQKCQVMGAAKAPLDIVGTGSFLPATLTETYATADIIAYDGVRRVKVGREFLFD
jgi:nicotinate phosphoribosyltransferase